ncbi:MAG TPA: hypothetical protein VFA60_03955, partial [Terriglobales bacterium]|nr:hypothetical protein [Terriglobales bacterium]
QNDPHWRDLILFYEYFHGDNGSGVGASHQTGWTGLVAKLLQQSGAYDHPRAMAKHARMRQAKAAALSQSQSARSTE